mgnify:FL=1
MKSISYKVKCGIILALALASLLSFALLPVITVRPSDFGVVQAKSGEIYCTVWNNRDGFVGLERKITDKIFIDEMKNLEEQYGMFADFIPGYSKEELHQAVKIVTWWMRFPIFLTIAIAAAFVGFLIAGGFAATGLAGVKNKWIHTGWSAAGAAVYILVGILLCYWGVKAMRDLTAILNNEAVKKIFDIQSLLGDSVSPTEGAVALFVHCVGPGLVIPWAASIAMVVLGLVGMRDTVTQENVSTGSESAPGEGWIDGVIPSLPEAAKGKIHVTSGEYAGYEIELDEGESICIGSNPQASQLVLSDRMIAPCHCRITCHRNDTKKSSVSYSGGGRYFSVTNLSADGIVKVDSKYSPSTEENMIPSRRTCEVGTGTEVSLGNGENKFLLV